MLDTWQLWMLAGIALWILEMFTPGFVAGVFGTACLVVAPFAGRGVSLTIQLLVFVVATAILFLLVRPIFLKLTAKSGPPEKTNADAMVGRDGVAVSAIQPLPAGGRVKIGGEEWRAAPADSSAIPEGARILVIKIEGNTLYVRVAA